MKFEKIALLTQANADQIAREWHYSDMYSFYDMENDQEDFEEIITPRLRANKYYQILDDTDELVGYFLLGKVIRGKGRSRFRIETGLDWTRAGIKFHYRDRSIYTE